MRIPIDNQPDLAKLLSGLPANLQVVMSYEDSKIVFPPGMPAVSAWSDIQTFANQNACRATNEPGLMQVVIRRAV